MLSMSTREVSPTRPTMVWFSPTDIWVSRPMLCSQELNTSTCCFSAFFFSTTIIFVSPFPAQGLAFFKKKGLTAVSL